MNIDVLKVFQMSMPFTTDDIYLKDNSKQIRAVCSNDVVAKFLADCVNAFSNVLITDIKKNEEYKKFIFTAAMLRTAILKANIPINSTKLFFLEKAFNKFSKELDEILFVDTTKMTNTLSSNIDGLDAELSSNLQCKESEDGKEQTKTTDSI